ncbi:DNA polymerase/3'-5' exonuclease PolX [Dethiothermospora halolimnae]|uniref:DNA polymerase/3'-5' exonuclease PolX n=1 Tax=Dethiothermospora halolimnae TaxID=3114390 RepID=UPI003CCB9D73
MPVHNSEISDIFGKMADLLEIKGANQFRVRAYRNGALSISNLSKSLRNMVSEGVDLTDIEGIGKDLSDKIKEIIETGYLEELQELELEFPGGLIDILKIQGLGPKKVKVLYDELNIGNVDELRKAAENNDIRKLSGFGAKTEENILDGIKAREEKGEDKRFLFAKAEEFILSLTEYIKGINGVNKVTVAGSYRRRKETIGDIDILVTCKDRDIVMDKFTNYEDVNKVVSQGNTKSTIILNSGLQVDLRVVDGESYGSALLYFTGSKAHNVVLRSIAKDKGLKVSEYGIFKGDKNLASKTEESVYKKLGLSYIVPELRENNGEVEASKNNQLPKLVELNDIKGDLQMHSHYSDGSNTIREMVEAARKMGYEYIAITDHSKRVTMAGGLKRDDVLKQLEEINKLNEEYDDITILKSIEVDILKDGTLDLSDDILKELDLTVCSTHYNRNLSREEQTKRILAAMENPYFNILAHPTGRIIGKRGEIDVDMEKIIESAKKNNCFLEINAYPKRLDLSDNYCRLAREMGLKLSISTDAHSINDLNNMIYGINQARRGWQRPEDIINTRSLKELLQLLKKD